MSRYAELQKAKSDADAEWRKYIEQCEEFLYKLFFDLQKYLEVPADMMKLDKQLEGVTNPDCTLCFCNDGFCQSSFILSIIDPATQRTTKSRFDLRFKRRGDVWQVHVDIPGFDSPMHVNPEHPAQMEALFGEIFACLKSCDTESLKNYLKGQSPRNEFDE